VELARFVLAAGGGEWGEPNLWWWFLHSFLLGLRCGWGETLHRPNVTGTATLVTGHHVSQQCQWALVSLKAMPLNYLQCSGPALAKKLSKYLGESLFDLRCPGLIKDALLLRYSNGMIELFQISIV
jgi:hypothetical protein